MCIIYSVLLQNLFQFTLFYDKISFVAIYTLLPVEKKQISGTNEDDIDAYDDDHSYAEIG